MKAQEQDWCIFQTVTSALLRLETVALLMMRVLRNLRKHRWFEHQSTLLWDEEPRAPLVSSFHTLRRWRRHSQRMIHRMRNQPELWMNHMLRCF